MKIVQQHLDYDNLYEFLHSSKKIRMSKDESIKEKYYNSFPKMKSRASFELLLDLLHDFEYDDINKDISGKSFINLVTIDGKPFKEQLLRISSNSFVNMDSSHELLEEKRNIKSMPMRIDSFQNIDLNYPLIPDNNDYSKILTYFSSSTIIDIFNGILLEEKILIVTDLIENFASIVESFNELLFPFNPNNYFTISFITEDMIDFLYAPVPYIIGCDSETFKSIQKFHWKHLESEIMCIQPSKNKILWQRKVRYPQPHTKYLCNTLETLMKNRNRFLIKGGLNKSLNQCESDLMHSLIGFIETNLRIKQAFLNFILILLNNFLAFNSYSIYLTNLNNEPKFNKEKYIESVNREYHQFYDRLLNTQMFASFLKEIKDNNCTRSKEFLKYYRILFKKTKHDINESESIDIVNSCNEKILKVDNKQEGSIFQYKKDDNECLAKMNKLKFKQNCQIERILKTIETLFSSTYHQKYEIVPKDNNIKNIIKNKLLPDEIKNKYIQRQSVVLSSMLDIHGGVKLDFNCFFTKLSLDQYIAKCNTKAKSEFIKARQEFKQNKIEHNSFVKGLQCHIHKDQYSKSCFFCQKRSIKRHFENKRKDFKYKGSQVTTKDEKSSIVKDQAKSKMITFEHHQKKETRKTVDSKPKEKLMLQNK